MKKRTPGKSSREDVPSAPGARPHSERFDVTPRAAQRTNASELRAARPVRWNPDPDDVQKSVVKLVLSLIEFIRKLMERQAIRRLEEKTLTPEEIENVGIALMKLEQTIVLIAKRFKLDPKI